MMSRLIRPGDCFVDIGAHCGLYSRLASRRLGATGTVIAVEPNLAFHPFLQVNLDVGRVLTTQDLTVGSVHIIGAAVAAESGEASMTTRSLESLVAATSQRGQVIIKLDTEDLEFDIVQQAVPFLKSRNDIHLMIQFDENNQTLGGHTTGELRKLLGDTGFALAIFDPESGMLLEHHSETPPSGANLVATKAIDLLNDRLRTIPEDVAQETNDFLQSGAVAEAIYRRSEQLDPVLRAFDAAKGAMADIAASLERQAIPKGSSDNNDAIASAPSALVASMQDQLAQLEGSARSVAQQLDAARETTATLNYGLGQIACRLKDQSTVVAREHALLKGEAFDGPPPQHPAATKSDPSIADVHRMTDEMSAEIGNFIGTAKWFAENYADLTSKVSQQVSALEASGQLQTETVKAEKALQTARLDLAALIAEATDLPASKRGSAGSASLKLEHSIKTALTTAASHLSYGRKSLSVVAPTAMPVESDDLSSELNRIRTAYRDLLAEIHRLGLIADKAKRSRWLRLGDRLGADVTRQLDTIVMLIADIEQRAVSSDGRPKAQA